MLNFYFLTKPNIKNSKQQNQIPKELAAKRIDSIIKSVFCPGI